MEILLIGITLILLIVQIALDGFFLFFIFHPPTKIVEPPRQEEKDTDQLPIDSSLVPLDQFMPNFEVPLGITFRDEVKN